MALGGKEGRPEKLKTNKTLLISNCYLRVEQSGEMPNKGFLSIDIEDILGGGFLTLQSNGEAKG